MFLFKCPRIYVTPNERFKCNRRLSFHLGFAPRHMEPGLGVTTTLTGPLKLPSTETQGFKSWQLETQSLVFNLKDKVMEEIKEKQKTQDELSSIGKTVPFPEVAPGRETPGGRLRLGFSVPALPGGTSWGSKAKQPQGPGKGAVVTLLAVVGFAAFACTIKCFLRYVTQEGAHRPLNLKR